MWNTCLRSGYGGLLGEELGNSFVSVIGSKLGVKKGSGGRNIVCLSGGGDKYGSAGPRRCDV